MGVKIQYLPEEFVWVIDNGRFSIPKQTIDVYFEQR
jgi:hypothetical protein